MADPVPWAAQIDGSPSPGQTPRSLAFGRLEEADGGDVVEGPVNVITKLPAIHPAVRRHLISTPDHSVSVRRTVAAGSSVQRCKTAKLASCFFDESAFVPVSLLSEGPAHGDIVSSWHT